MAEHADPYYFMRNWWECPARFCMEYAERASGGHVTTWRIERGGVPRLVFNMRVGAELDRVKHVVVGLARLEKAWAAMGEARRLALMPEKVA